MTCGRPGTSKRLFQERGLPLVIRSDNGVPFASPNGPVNLSRLSVWWLRVGMRIERIQLGQTLYAWREEIAAMWRFTGNNGLTEGFNTVMEIINRRAFGFRNFGNYRMRVEVLCG